MFASKSSSVRHLFVVMTAINASALCSTRAHAQSPAAGPVSAFELTACTVEGGSRVIATHISPRAGVQAEADASRVWLRFAHVGTAPLLALAVDPTSLQPLTLVAAAPLPLGKALVTQVAFIETQRPEPADEVGAPIVGLASKPGERVAGPVVVKVDRDRAVWAWTSGSMYSGMDVWILTVDGHGDPIGSAITVSHDGNAMGLVPAIALDTSGRGLVAFVASNERGFDVVASSIDCGTPVDAPPTSWAMETSL
jgi:hypothetical protein